MFSPVESLVHGAAVQSCGPARVADVSDDGQLLVELDNGELRWARAALPYRVEVGDEALVLVAGEAAFVIGAFGSAPQAAEKSLQVERDPRTGRTRVTVPAGDLELAAPAGAITLNAAAGVRVIGESVDLVGRDQVRATALGPQGSQLQLAQRSARLKTPSLDVQAETTRVAGGDIQLQAQTFDAKLEDAAIQCDSLTTIARTISQTAGDWYQRVSGLVQLLAGRTETVVEESVHLEAERAIYETEKDFKIGAEQIHLG